MMKVTNPFLTILLSFFFFTITTHPNEFLVDSLLPQRFLADSSPSNDLIVYDIGGRPVQTSLEYLIVIVSLKEGDVVLAPTAMGIDNHKSYPIVRYSDKAPTHRVRFSYPSVNQQSVIHQKVNLNIQSVVENRVWRLNEDHDSAHNYYYDRVTADGDAKKTTQKNLFQIHKSRNDSYTKSFNDSYTIFCDGSYIALAGSGYLQKTKTYPMHVKFMISNNN